ncbi:unnamed protein product, partial [Didymodactylos carnosus]
LPPQDLNCTKSNETFNETTTIYSYTETTVTLVTRKKEPDYSYSNTYGLTVLTEFNELCDDIKRKIPYIVYMVSLIIGGLVFGYAADHNGRKATLLGSTWVIVALSIFQLLSDDYISYVFFIFFIGFPIGAVQVTTVPYVIEMFPINSRTIYGLFLSATVILLDHVLPWLSFSITNWKNLQLVVTVPLLITILLIEFAEESMFWFVARKDYVTAILSLTKIADYNGVIFQNLFPDTNNFLHLKHSKEIQCDFQPLLRLEDLATLKKKYPNYDMADLQQTAEKGTKIQRLLSVIKGQHYKPTLSTFYPTDYFHSFNLSIYLFVLCSLWLINALSDYSFDTLLFTRHLPEDYFLNYFYQRLIEIASFLVAFPLVYTLGRRWPTFSFYVIAGICLVISVIVKLESEYIRIAGPLVIYFIGKFAIRASFIITLLFTCEIFPTGLRCTTLGICYMFRLIGMAIASKNIAEQAPTYINRIFFWRRNGRRVDNHVGSNDISVTPRGSQTLSKRFNPSYEQTLGNPMVITELPSNGNVNDNFDRIAQQHQISQSTILMRDKTSENNNVTAASTKHRSKSTSSHSQKHLTAQIQSGDVTNGGLQPVSSEITTIDFNDDQENDE